MTKKKRMQTSVTISLPKKEKTRLSRLALQYGLSLPELTRAVLQELHDQFPTEDISGYENPKELEASLNRALRGWRAGRVKTTLVTL